MENLSKQQQSIVDVRLKLEKATMDHIAATSLLQSMATAGRSYTTAQIIDQQFENYIQPNWLALQRLKSISVSSWHNVQQYKSSSGSERAQSLIGKRIQQPPYSKIPVWAARPSRVNDESLLAADVLARLSWPIQDASKLGGSEAMLRERIEIENFVLALSPQLLTKLVKGESLCVQLS